MKSTALIFGLALILSGSPALASTHSDYTKAYSLQSLKTYAFKDQHRISRDPLANNDIWASDVKQSIRTDLGQHGYVEATNGNPDFYVAFYVGLNERYDVSAMGYGVPVFHRRGWWGWPGSYDVWSVPYTESTLIVDVIDAKTNQLIWRGYDTDTLNTGKPEKTLDSAVDHIVSRLSHDTGRHNHA